MNNHVSYSPTDRISCYPAPHPGLFDVDVLTTTEVSCSDILARLLTSSADGPSEFVRLARV